MTKSLLQKLYRLTKPVLFKLDPERAHGVTSLAMRAITPAIKSAHIENRPAQIIFDRKVHSPIGIAAGFDKFCHAPLYLYKLGFGFVESGSLTPKPQAGNPKPRLARIPDQQVLLNKMGFNNPGFLAGWKNLRARIAVAPHTYQVALSLGKGKETDVERAVDDYTHCLGVLKADPMSEFLFYIAINVSSPNTPNLRALQKGTAIKKLVAACAKVSPRPVVVKFAADFTDLKTYRASLTAALDGGAEGIIICNTTVAHGGAGLTHGTRRSSASTDHGIIPVPAHLTSFGGGLSGKSLAEKSRAYLSETLKVTKGKIPVISSGGVFSPQEAKVRLDMGADLVQLYTGFIYYGPDFARDFLKLI